VIAVAKKSVRVAIYARVSVSDGLEKEFNSIDAQREACAAYVASQRGAGWTALPERYEDGGYTGANTDRPAFQQLLADIEAGKVDVVAVYKIDRLSRSLLDFTQLLETFRRRNVAFVSVTQSFDTSTPMGRMVVSLLATFAQFERETTSERVRDKMLATRRRGMWSGGRPALGYDVVERKLVVNAQEAERVREIFAMYLDMGSLLAVSYELAARGWATKSWTSKRGAVVGGTPFTKNSVHDLLRNCLYVGKIRCGSELVEALHTPIIERATWDEVQARLASGAATPRGWRPPTRNGAVLRGLLRCSCGSSMIHHSARRHGRTYSFYVCSRALKLGAKACPGSRAPMGELEAFVIDRVRQVGRDPRVLAATVKAGGGQEPELRRALEEFEPVWSQLTISERSRVLGLLLERVTFDAESGEVEIKFRPTTKTTCSAPGTSPTGGQANHQSGETINGQDLRPTHA
jgi:site-specific DNA recombinase